MEEPRFNIANLINPREAITVIYSYEEIIKTQNKETIAYVAKQGQILKKFKDTEEFVENMEQSPSTVYFNIELYKFIKKFPALKNSTLSSNYFKNNFKRINTVCKNHAELFS